MIFEHFKQQLPDADPDETRDWIDSLDALVEKAGAARAQFVLYKLLKRARMLDVGLPRMTQTRYINTISPEEEPPFPGDEEMERRIRRLIRWNAVAMVHRANTRHPGLGGHLSSYASAASLYEVGFNHFFRGRDAEGGGDLVYFQGHAAPGIYARAFLEGRLGEAQLDSFRREAGGRGLSSYPHPRLMPEFWEFPTVSMGLGPINAIYQARFARYLRARGLKDTSAARVWAFLGDGEMDEPESTGALTIAAREGLDNLIFVVNCNLQRLDGPVRGNGKIIQELEAVFRGAGWRVIKVLWGREWDELLARDVDGALVEKLNDTVDGDWQRFVVESGGYVREHFFGEPPLRALVAHLSDEQIARLRRGGHDYRKLYAAYDMATRPSGAPTVILAQTVKGWTLGEGVEGRNVTHQVKKLSDRELRVFRDRLELPIPDAALHDAPYHHPGEGAPEIRYMRERRRLLGGPLPRRVVAQVPLGPAPTAYAELLQGTAAGVEVSTTTAMVRLLRRLLKDATLGPRVVPIIPDEGRTFGMEPLFSEVKIYNPHGQRYVSVDAEFVVGYREAVDGRILEEGITEAGSMASTTAAGTSYATYGAPMLPFFLFYSMFGFQRVADAIWAFADARGRGFLLGATAGRTTLNGEGLQHQDGHGLLVASTVPCCRAYDPAFAYEVALIVEDGVERMMRRGEDVFYYLTLYNEARAMPAAPEPVEETRRGVLRGLYLLRAAPGEGGPRAQILASGPIVAEAERAQAMLLEEHGVRADLWSATSYGELRREALECERWSRLHPTEAARAPLVTRLLAPTEGPIVAVSDNVKTLPDLVARWLPRELVTLGTDGFGRSDTRAALRRLFEVDAEHIVVAVLGALARRGDLPPAAVERAIESLGLEPESAGPLDR